MHIARRYRDTDPGLNDLLQWAALVDSGVVQCKDGSFLAGWFYEAPDASSLTDEMRNYYSERINSALARLGSGWASWTECYRIPAPGYPEPHESHFPDPVSALIDAERRRLFTGDGVFSTGHALIVQFTPPLRIKRKIADMLYTGGDDGEDGYAARALREFKVALDSIESAIGRDVIQLRRMGGYPVQDEWGLTHERDQLVNFLKFCMDGAPADLNLPRDGAYLDAILCNKEFRPGDPLLLGRDYVRPIVIEGFPAESWPQMLEMLAYLPIAYRWSSRMIYLDQHDAIENIKKYRRHWTQQVRGFWSQVFKTGGGQINEDALEMSQEAGVSLRDASSGLVTFGYYTSVVILTSPDLREIEAATKIVREALRSLGFAERAETDNAAEAWLGSLPGHTLPNIRRPHIHTALLADLIPLSAPWTGTMRATSAYYPSNAPPLLHALASGSTPFGLNLHVNSVGHTMILGPTGSGKSVLLSTLALSALRYAGATICAFDVGRSMYACVNGAGGRHYDIAGDRAAPAFSPLSVLDTENDLDFAEEWVATCFQLQHGRAPNPTETPAIHRTIELLKKQPDLRTVSHFAAMVPSEAVRDAMAYYSLTGTAGRLFDAREDGISDAHFVVHEIGGLMEMGERTAIPALLYLFRRFERSLKGQPAFLLLDEAWLMLAHPVFRQKIKEWLKTMRKANCAVVLATQNLADALRSGIFSELIESCPTKIFLPNPEALNEGKEGHPGPLDLYRMFGLNMPEIMLISKATQQREYFVRQGENRGMIDLALGLVALSFSGLSAKAAPAAVARIDALKETHGEQWPFVWLKEKGVDYESLLSD